MENAEKVSYILQKKGYSVHPEPIPLTGAGYVLEVGFVPGDNTEIVGFSYWSHPTDSMPDIPALIASFDPTEYDSYLLRAGISSALALVDLYSIANKELLGGLAFVDEYQFCQREVIAWEAGARAEEELSEGRAFCFAYDEARERQKAWDAENAETPGLEKFVSDVITAYKKGMATAPFYAKNKTLRVLSKDSIRAAKTTEETAMALEKGRRGFEDLAAMIAVSIEKLR